jgi:hypothetical protein
MQAEMLNKGLNHLLPSGLLNFMSNEDLQIGICGTFKIDI